MGREGGWVSGEGAGEWEGGSGWLGEWEGGSGWLGE